MSDRKSPQIGHFRHTLSSDYREGQGGGKTLVKVQRVHPSIFRPCRLDTIGRLRATSAA
ncbi:hypothetical protein FA13DRAFT_1733592 [Coprinellus micaceus]|uniref:Uncharacterized protein n=1 Tax=Coprinellus micaceus TaxID=71717 RepID=A0A4Y7T858_COPMI|nr:hypothetical protein FA13DRAFT_1733592 [Coprinellus micaceus]